MSERAPLERLVARTWRRFAPPPKMTVAEWADTYRILSPEYAAEPGRWRTSRTPYMREPMSVITDRDTETVVIMASSQVGKTEVLHNCLGYTMHLHPRPTLYVQPTLDTASAVSKDRLGPMIRDTAPLRGLVAPPRGRDGSNTTFHKTFPGGHLTLAGANSPASLASRPIAFLLADEVDRWEASVGHRRGRQGSPQDSGSEGDPLALAVKRTTTFRGRKIVITSSPTVKGASRIEDWYEISDQRRYWTPCPRCREPFVFAWEHIRWAEGVPEAPWIECPACSGRIEDTERGALMAAGVWKADKPFAGIAGFHIWSGFALWRSLAEQVAEFLRARRSLEMRQVWTNTALGRTWEVPGERIDPGSLILRRVDYGAAVPEGVRLITAGVDTQDDRLEALVVGWGDGEEGWILERVPLLGDPGRSDVWRELDDLLDFDWPHARGGTMRIQCALVDSAGHRTQAVYNAVVPRQVRRVYATIGRSGGERGMLVSPPKAIRAQGGGTVQRRVVDVDQAKALLFSRLRVTDPGPEYLHFPMSVGEAFFDELTAERLVTKRNKYGVPTKTWEQIRERNESLDCLVLALAALRVVAPNAARFGKLAGEVDTMRVLGRLPRPDAEALEVAG